MRRRAWAGLVVAGGVVAAGLLDTDDARGGDTTSCQVAAPQGDNGEAEIVIHRAGSEHTLVEGAVVTDPSFSPDGARVAVVHAIGDYESSGPEATGLWTLPADGGEPTVLVPAVGFVDGPDWSPSGASIAYAELVDGSFELRTIPASGGDPTTILRDADSNLWAPAWSPDGTTIAYMATDGRVGLVGANGSADRTLTEVGDAFWLAWSPDGRSLLVSTLRGDNDGRVLQVDIVDGSVHEIATGATMAASSVDGTVLHLHHVEESSWRVAESRLDGDELEHVRFIGEDVVYPYLYFAIDGAPCPDR
jgi:dipeptidyl aminopeptidase/acylaminoacyl peptidase